MQSTNDSIAIQGATDGAEGERAAWLGSLREGDIVSYHNQTATHLQAHPIRVKSVGREGIRLQRVTCVAFPQGTGDISRAGRTERINPPTPEQVRMLHHREAVGFLEAVEWGDVPLEVAQKAVEAFKQDESEAGAGARMERCRSPFSEIARLRRRQGEVCRAHDAEVDGLKRALRQVRNLAQKREEMDPTREDVSTDWRVLLAVCRAALGEEVEG